MPTTATATPLTANHLQASIKLINTSKAALTAYGTAKIAVVRWTDVSLDFTYNTYDTTSQASGGFMRGGVSTRGVSGSISLIPQKGNAFFMNPNEVRQANAAEILLFAMQQEGEDSQVEIEIMPITAANFTAIKFRANITSQSLAMTHHENATSSFAFSSSGMIQLTTPALAAGPA